MMGREVCGPLLVLLPDPPHSVKFSSTKDINNTRKIRLETESIRILTRRVVMKMDLLATLKKITGSVEDLLRSVGFLGCQTFEMCSKVDRY